MTSNTFFTELVRQVDQHASKSIKDIDNAILKWITITGGENVRLSKITPLFCEKMVWEMDSKGISLGSRRTYLTRLSTLLHKAIGDKAPNLRTYIPTTQRSRKTPLTKEDVSSLLETRCRHESTKRAFLFSLNTGLRFSDVATLRWGNIIGKQNTWFIYKRMKKTGMILTTEINRNAYEILRKEAYDQHTNIYRACADDLVFQNLMSYNTIREDLLGWAYTAKVSIPHMTFHVARHTFASVLCASSIPLTTISHLLGHTSIQTTETYLHSFASDEHIAITLLNAFGSKS